MGPMSPARALPAAEGGGSHDPNGACGGPGGQAAAPGTFAARDETGGSQYSRPPPVNTFGVAGSSVFPERSRS